jgi:hypothetical protein
MGDNLDELGIYAKSFTKEFTKKPADLSETQLKKAKGMAEFLTIIRKLSYFFFSVVVVIVVYSAIQNYNILDIFKIIANIILSIYLLFKLRDLIRGTI